MLLRLHKNSEIKNLLVTWHIYDQHSPPGKVILHGNWAWIRSPLFKIPFFVFPWIPYHCRNTLKMENTKVISTRKQTRFLEKMMLFCNKYFSIIISWHTVATFETLLWKQCLKYFLPSCMLHWQWERCQAHKYCGAFMTGIPIIWKSVLVKNRFSQDFIKKKYIFLNFFISTWENF